MINMTNCVPIIILNWNGLEDTVECISSVMGLHGIEFEVFLVDNNSSNDEGQKLLELYGDESRIHIILNEENQGFTQGNNVIIKQLLDKGYSYVVLLNNDTVVTPNWLKNLVDSAKKHDADMVSSKMINYYDRSIMDNAGHYMLNTAEILPIAHAEPVNRYNNVFENMGACGGAALYTSKMLKEIGLFDSFFTTGYEDAELGLRAKLKGYKLIFEPSAIVYHKVSRSIVKIRNRKYIEQIQRNIFYSYIKNLPKGYVLKNLPWILLKYSTIIIGSIIFLRFSFILIHFNSIFSFISKDLRKAIAQNKILRQSPKQSTSKSALEQVKFFLFTDMRRFYTIAKSLKFKPL